MRIVEWMQPLFRDRAAAGRALAEALLEAQVEQPVVVGVARGGVAVAAEVAQALGAPLTAVDVERVNARRRRLGAVTAEGPVYLRERHGVPDGEVEHAVARARRNAAALEERIAHDRARVAGCTAVLVDDGLVTGLTLAAACRWAHTERPSRVIAATPVGHPDGLALLRAEADAIVCPHVLEALVVVGQAYDSFDPLDEWYVSALLAARR